jgi:hypothetical protein
MLPDEAPRRERVMPATGGPRPSDRQRRTTVREIGRSEPALIDVGSAFDVTRVVEELHPHGRHVNAIGSHLVLQAGIR